MKLPRSITVPRNIVPLLNKEPKTNMRRDVVSRLLVPTFALRAILAALAAALLLSISDIVLAQAASGMAEDQRILPYVKPGQLVDIGGRRINVQCAGAGTPTVILMAGTFSWSVVWYKTQPVIAQQTRVCAFDRAAYGFSDPAPQPQIISEVVEDLHKALHTGSIPGPYVLVGHSLGGVEARVYAQRWPEEVAGMVLVDTSPAGEGLIDENQPDFDEAAGRERYAPYMLHCAFLAMHGLFEPSSSEFKDCSATLPSDTPAAFRKIWPQFFTAYYFADKVSLMSSLYTHRYDSADHHRLGAMPLVVLSIEHPWDIRTPAGARLSRSYGKIWNALHADLARLSSRGVHRIIKNSGHEIQLDQPQAVIDAVDEVLRQLHCLVLGTLSYGGVISMGLLEAPPRFAERNFSPEDSLARGHNHVAIVVPAALRPAHVPLAPNCGSLAPRPDYNRPWPSRIT
jgi:pimeloyl-ACP methyl ester carboxylesterase